MKKYSLFLLLIIAIAAMISCGESTKAPYSISRIYHTDIDSSPRAASVFWHVLSKTDQVSSTNRFFLGQTPIEATNSLRIPNLTEENAKDVQIVIEVEKNDCTECYTRTFYVNAYSVLTSRGISIFADLKNNK